MGKAVIEEDYRNIDWVEDYPRIEPEIPESVLDEYFNILDQRRPYFTGEDHDHWFTVIDGDKVEIIPASQYKGEE